MIVLLLLIYTLTGCKKENQLKNVNATIIDAGDVAADGCGWLIKIDDTNTVYFPVNLADTYKKDKLLVTVNYHLLTTKHQCSTNPNNVLSEINIDAILKK